MRLHPPLLIEREVITNVQGVRMLRMLLIIRLWMSYFRLVSNYVAAFLLSLGPCGALSLCGMCMMEFHFPLGRWV